MKNKVGIVILNYNGSEYLDVTLDALCRAKVKTAFEVGVIDNGSSLADAKRCRELCRGYFEQTGLPGFFIPSNKNLGFSGGNNVVIRRFLEDPSITHICLLNSDVIVTDGWLDILLSTRAEAVGPVTNATGNEQTVAADYTVELGKAAFEAVNTFAKKRNAVYGDYTTESDILNFFNTVFSRSVFERIGLLDERFYPGSYEDNDFCLRMQNAGISMIIARGCYVHHFGSGSFSTLDMSRRLSIADTNRRRFEEKWGIECNDTSWKLLESCRQDMVFLEKDRKSDWALGLVSVGMTEIENMIRCWTAPHVSPQSEPPAQPAMDPCTAAATLTEYVCGTELLKIAFKKAVIKLVRLLHLDKLLLQDTKATEPELCFETLLHMARSRRSICVFSPMFTKENEKDGYVQRVRAIDGTILQDYLKFYIMNDPACIEPSLQRFDDNHFYIVFNSHDAVQREEVFRLVRLCGITYTHSLLRFMTDSVSPEMGKVFSLPHIRHIWDVHGSVPEEYELNGDRRGAELADEVEALLYARADVIVCVNRAMEKHLRGKHGDTCARFIVLPIFSPGVLKRLDSCEAKKLADGELPRLIYAGGTQKWQNMELMQDIMEKTMTDCEYRIFVPHPEEFHVLWGDRTPLKNALISSRNPEDMAEEYHCCHYGLLLRDDIVVNNVACPTKLVEYLQYGIVPILKSDRIGDFAESGLRYVKYTDLLSGKMPSMQERERMAEENYRIIESFGKTQAVGTENLSSLVREYSKRPVGLVVTTFDKGGMEQVVLNLYKGYKMAGYPTYLLCQKNILGAMAAEIEPGDLIVFNDSEQQFCAAVQHYNITTLHYHYNTFYLRQMHELGVRTLYTMHNVYTWKSDREIREYAQILKHADVVVPVSKFVQNYFASRTGNVCGNLHTILNGIDFEELSLRDLPEGLTRKALEIDGGDIVFVFIASFHPAKGQTGMIGVMEQLIRHTPNSKLLLVGNIGSSDYYHSFESALRDSPAKDNILLIPYFEHRYMGEFLRSTADVFILPTLQEGCSNAVLEAVYCDKPIIVTRVGNANEVEALPACRVINPPYPDITQLSHEDLVEISKCKDMHNQQELVAAMMEMAGNIQEFKSKAVMPEEEKNIYSCDSMVNAYLELLL